MGEIESGMDSAELTEWQAWEDEMGPLGPDRLDLLAGIIASTQVNVWRDKDKPPIEPLDPAIIPDWGGLRAKAKEEEAARKKEHEAEAWRIWHEVRCGFSVEED